MIMSGIIMISAATLLVAILIAWSQRRNPMHVAPREESLRLKVQIICGDCAGFDRLPRRTFLTRKGQCEQCGGHSFILASAILRPMNPGAQDRAVARMLRAKIAV